MGETANSKLSAPYVSYGIFSKSIEILSETTVPTGPIDRRVLNVLSGADYGALISALRFLGLVDEERNATAEFRELVGLRKDEQKFKKLLLQTLDASYKPITGSLNLKQGTAAQLEKAFKDFGVAQGQMLTKTIRFFLKAYTDAGVTPSHYMTAPKPRTYIFNRRNNPAKVPDSRSGELNGESSQDVVPSGWERLPLPGMPNSFIQYPAKLTEAHCQILEAMVSLLRTSVKARSGGQE
jgi:hypothetical protein